MIWSVAVEGREEEEEGSVREREESRSSRH